MTDSTPVGPGDQRFLRNLAEQHANALHIAAIFTDPCRKCWCEAPHAIAGYRKRNGVVAARGWCEVCRAWITSDLAFPRRYRTDTYLVIVQDNSSDPNHAECERCRKTGPVENHHWAPISIFLDAWDWPMSLLCPDCHREWHVRTGVALGGGRKEAA